MLEKLQTLKTNTQDWLVEYGTKLCVTVSTVSASVMAMTIPASAEGEIISSSITSDATTIFSLMGQGIDFIIKYPVLSVTFVGGLIGGVIFGNIKRAKRAVK